MASSLDAKKGGLMHERNQHVITGKCTDSVSASASRAVEQWKLATAL